MAKSRRTTVHGTLPRLLLVAGLLLATISFALPATADTAWQPTGDMLGARVGHTMTMLPNGRVLAIGGADSVNNVLRPIRSVELYNPVTGTWTARTPMRVTRFLHSATLLNDGTVLVAGGVIGTGASLVSTEVYNPISNSWVDGPDMHSARNGHTTLLLANGDVFVAGSSQDVGEEHFAERYDPVSGTWALATGMTNPRRDHTTTLLADGSVLVAGGHIAGVESNSAERYDPNLDSWSDAGVMGARRTNATATRLLDGQVLVVGGTDENSLVVPTTERYDPVANSWSPSGVLVTGRLGHTAVLLSEGSVLVAGGRSDEIVSLATMEMYDPATNTWTQGDSMLETHALHAGVLLNDGSVLVSGGLDIRGAEDTSAIRSAERFPPDELPVVIRTPLQGLRLGALQPTTIPVTTDWNAIDADGIARFFLSRQRDGSAFTGVPLPDPLVSSITEFLLPGGSHTYRLRVADGRGTRSDLAAGPAKYLDARNETHVSIAYTGTWNTSSNPQFFSGAARFTGAAGARATLSFTGTSVAWVTGRAPNRGMAEIWLDGARVATIDLFSPTTRVRQIMFARNGLTNSAHTLEIRVLGTRNAVSTGNRVDIDAFIVLR